MTFHLDPELDNIYNLIGVFWIGEFISTAIGIEYCDAAIGCSDAICYTQLVLDIPNLLAVLKPNTSLNLTTLNMF